MNGRMIGNPDFVVAILVIAIIVGVALWFVS
jgi:uncharacterized membrane protein (DUF106 family)